MTWLKANIHRHVKTSFVVWFIGCASTDVSEALFQCIGYSHRSSIPRCLLVAILLPGTQIKGMHD